MLTKTSLIFTTLIFSCSLIFAQQVLYKDVAFSDNLLKDWSIGFNYGTTFFNGDIRQDDYFPASQTGLKSQDSDFKEL